MNGPSAEEDSSVRRPNRSRSARIGSSHHFLFSRRKNQKSVRRFARGWPAAIRSSSSSAGSLTATPGSGLAKIAVKVPGPRPGGPVTVTPRAPEQGQGVPADQPEEQPDRSEHAPQHDRQHGLGNYPADGTGQARPG